MYVIAFYNLGRSNCGTHTHTHTSNLLSWYKFNVVHAHKLKKKGKKKHFHRPTLPTDQYQPPVIKQKKNYTKQHRDGRAVVWIVVRTEKSCPTHFELIRDGDCLNEINLNVIFPSHLQQVYVCLMYISIKQMKISIWVEHWQEIIIWLGGLRSLRTQVEKNIS